MNMYVEYWVNCSGNEAAVPIWFGNNQTHKEAAA